MSSTKRITCFTQQKSNFKILHIYVNWQKLKVAVPRHNPKHDNFPKVVDLNRNPV